MARPTKIPPRQGLRGDKASEVILMRGYDTIIFKLFLEIGAELTTWEWGEVYKAILKKTTEFKTKEDVLATIYNAVKVRSDYITASRVVQKFSIHFDDLFEKLPKCGESPEYFAPTEACGKLFLLLAGRYEAVEELGLTNEATEEKGRVRT